MKKTTDEIMKEYASKDPLFKEIYEDYFAYQRKARAWSMMSEYHYLKSSQEVE
jgi:TRAP-type mannitol/chloroaromatic compound transport system substrate-binding protein